MSLITHGGEIPESDVVLRGTTRFRWQELLAPILLVVVLSYGASRISASIAFLVLGTLSTLVMVLALQVFIGNSGVLSFGQSAFAMIGGFASGLATVPLRIKENVLDGLWGPLQTLQMGLWPSIVLAMVVAGAFAFITGLFLMRLNGLSAGIATFALLMVADSVMFNWKLIGPAAQVLPQIPKFAFVDEAIGIAIVAIVVAYFFGISRRGRLLRATREDGLAARALGANTWRLRVLAFTLSGAMAGVAGAMYGHYAGALSVRDFYLGFTFTTLAMLVIGGTGSVWGAVVGTVVVAGIGQVLLMLEQGLSLGTLVVTVPNGTRGLVIAAALVVILMWRPGGITGGREFRLPRRRARA
jgi:branched-chain amino acid transport system permease protein